jgi:hypothetical protein
MTKADRWKLLDILYTLTAKGINPAFIAGYVARYAEEIEDVKEAKLAVRDTKEANLAVRATDSK